MEKHKDFTEIFKMKHRIDRCQSLVTNRAEPIIAIFIWDVIFSSNRRHATALPCHSLEDEGFCT